MDGEVTWLLIGTGDIVKKRVAAALCAAAGSHLVGVRGGEGRAEEVAGTFGAGEVFHDVDEALSKTKADAVYVATPVNHHSREAVAALRAGKHVLVEKPLGLRTDDAREIVVAAERTHLQAGCAYYRRCFPRYAHLRNVLAEGALGRIVAVRICCWSWFHPEPDDPKFWRVQKHLGGGGPLADMGCHLFDLPNAENVHQPLVEDFVDSIINQHPPVVPVVEALKTNLLLDGIFESARTAKAVKLV